MNAADHRRLTPVLVVVCAVLAAGVAVIAAGFGERVDWGKSTPVATAPAPVSTTASPPVKVQPLMHYAAVWEKPLFNPGRKPAPESGGSGHAQVSIGDLELTGIMLTPHVRMALLHDHRSGRNVRVREGGTLPDSSWTLRQLQPRSAVFVQGEQRTELVLKVPDAPPAAGIPEDKAPATPASKLDVRRGYAVSTNASKAAPPEPGKSKSTPAFQDNATQRRARLQALKARIEERRRQMQAQQHGDR